MRGPYLLRILGADYIDYCCFLGGKFGTLIRPEVDIVNLAHTELSKRHADCSSVIVPAGQAGQRGLAEESGGGGCCRRHRLDDLWDCPICPVSADTACSSPASGRPRVNSWRSSAPSLPPSLSFSRHNRDKCLAATRTACDRPNGIYVLPTNALRCFETMMKRRLTNGKRQAFHSPGHSHTLRSSSASLQESDWTAHCLRSSVSHTRPILDRRSLQPSLIMF